jgi:hypothetical protein
VLPPLPALSVQSILESGSFEGGCGLNINSLVKCHAVLAAFPLHTWAEKQALEQRMLKLFMAPWKTPMVRPNNLLTNTEEV